MNELGQLALEVFRAHPNVAPETEESTLQAHCERLGAEMAAQVEDQKTQLWFRAQAEAEGRQDLRVHSEATWDIDAQLATAEIVATPAEGLAWSTSPGAQAPCIPGQTSGLTAG